MPSEAELRANRRGIGIYRAPTVYPNRRGLVLLSQKENKLRENPQRQPACTQRELEGGHPHAGVRTLPAPPRLSHGTDVETQALGGTGAGGAAHSVVVLPAPLRPRKAVMWLW